MQIEQRGRTDATNVFYVFYGFYAFAIGSPRGMQTKQQGRTNAMPAAPYKVTWAVI